MIKKFIAIKIKSKFLNLILIILSLIVFVILSKSFKIRARVSDEKINIYYCVDDNNILRTCVSMASVLSNLDRDIDNKIDFYFVCDDKSDLSEDSFLKLDRLKKIYSDIDFEYKIIKFDMSRLKEFDTEVWHKSIMLKLYACELFKELDKILFLDDDIMIASDYDLRELFNKDLSNKYLAGVDVSQVYNKYWHARDPRKSRDSDYWIGAGVLLFNLDLMRKDNIQEKLLASARDYSKSKKYNNNLCGGIEEYALSQVIDFNHALILPYRYNIYVLFFNINKSKSLAYSQEYDLEFKNNKLIHFAGDKPWRDIKLFNSQASLDYLTQWWRYAKQADLSQDLIDKYINKIKNQEERQKFLDLINNLD
jgi:lipopolysaccharide biosynthesis glycosyltransferase